MAAHTDLQDPFCGVTEGWQSLEVGAGVCEGKASQAGPGIGQHPSWDAVSTAKQHWDARPAPKATVDLPVLLSPPHGVTQRRATSRKQGLPTHKTHFWMSQQMPPCPDLQVLGKVVAAEKWEGKERKAQREAQCSQPSRSPTGQTMA